MSCNPSRCLRDPRSHPINLLLQLILLPYKPRPQLFELFDLLRWGGFEALLLLLTMTVSFETSSKHGVFDTHLSVLLLGL